MGTRDIHKSKNTVKNQMGNTNKVFTFKFDNTLIKI